MSWRTWLLGEPPVPRSGVHVIPEVELPADFDPPYVGMSPLPEKENTMTFGITKRSTFETDIVLGERYRDDQTGIEGVATAVYFFQHGCERVNIEIVNKDGELKEYSFDAPRLTHIESGVRATTTRTGGPDKGADPRRSAPSRR